MFLFTKVEFRFFAIFLVSRMRRRFSAVLESVRIIEIINNTRGCIVMFFTEKKGNAFFGGQIRVPNAGPGADWLS